MTEEEIDRVRSAVARAVRAVSPGWLSGEAEDLAQEATLKILEKQARDATPPSDLNATYLWRTAHSVVIDRLRQRRRRPTLPLEEEGARIEPPSPDAGPEARLRGARIRAALRECLAALVAPRRRAVSLHLLGHTVAEIAALCGWPGKRADNLVYRGLADLRGCLSAKGHGDER